MPKFRRDRIGTLIMQGPPQEVIAAAASEAAETAVTTEIANRDLVETTDPRLPARENVADDLLAAITDAEGRRTWLEARQSDGGPTDWSIGFLSAVVGDELSGRRLVDESDPRLPSLEEAPDDLLAGFVDADGRQTWLGARQSDGGPTDWAMTHLVKRMGARRDPDISTILASLTDANGAMTDMTVRRSDGQLADFVVDRLASRLGARLGVGQGDYVLHDGAVRPATADARTIAGWGSSHMQGMTDALEPHFRPRGIRFVNEGKGGGMSFQAAARLGARPALLTFPTNTIPASGTVAVTSSNLGGTHQELGTRITNNANLKTYTGTVEGVHGTLAWNATTLQLEFTRTTAGAAVSVAADVPLVPDVGPTLRRAMTLLWPAKNDLHGVVGTVQGVIDNVDAMIAYLTPLHLRMLLLGEFINTDTPEVSIRRDRIYQYNAAMKDRYGPLFIDIDAFVRSPDLWTLTGITPTQADLDMQAIGNIPPSVSSDGAHFDDPGDRAVARLIIDRMTALGWIERTPSWP